MSIHKRFHINILLFITPSAIKKSWSRSSSQRGEQLLSPMQLKKKNCSKLLNISPSINIYILHNTLDTSLHKEKKKTCKGGKGLLILYSYRIFDGWGRVSCNKVLLTTWWLNDVSRLKQMWACEKSVISAN